MSRKHSTIFGTMDSGTKFISLICLQSFADGSTIFLYGEPYRSKFKVFHLQKYSGKRCSTRFKSESIIFLIYVNDIPNPIHHQTNKSQFADDAGQCPLTKKY